MTAIDWRQIMAQYHNKNYVVIPLNSQRIPLITGWPQYQSELPSEPLYDLNQKGIGILPGPESGVMFVDIDSKDPSVIDRLKQILPTSPIQRFGSKGVMLAYQYNEKLHSCKFNHIEVELFIDSGYVTLPPSHHPKTGGSYKWLSEKSLLDFPKEMLPTFDQETLDKLAEFDEQYARANPPDSTGEIKKGGRHNDLLSQAFAGLHANKSIETIAEELVRYDMSRHQTSWFVEEMRARNEDELLKCAIKFVESANETFKKKNPIVKKTAAESFKPVPYPKPEGFMLALLNYLMPQFREESFESCLTGAICLMSVLCGNRFRYKGSFSNMYVINLAETGSGKSYAMKKVIKDLLMPVARDLVGRGSYQSESAIWHEFVKRKTFIDTLDEVSALFKRVGDNDATYSELLLNLWDDAPYEWLTPQYSALNKEAAKLPQSICNPCLTIWGASTIKTFESVINEASYQTGLLPRALILIKEGHGKIQDPQEPTESAIATMKSAIKHYLQHVPFVVDGKDMTADTKMVTRDLDGDETANQLFKDYNLETQIIMQNTKDEAPKGFLSRYPQHLAKLSMIHAVSRSFFSPQESKVLSQDVEWAHAFISAMRHNNSLFYTRTSTKGGYERQKAQVLASIAKAQAGLTKTDLTRTYRMNGKVMEQIIQDLLNAELIFKIEDSPTGKPGRPKVRYFPADE